MPFYAKNARIYGGSGANALVLQDEETPIRGNVAIEDTVILKQEVLAGAPLIQTFVIGGYDSTLTFEHIILEGTDKVDRLSRWMGHLPKAASDGDIGNIVALTGDEALWLRGVFRASANAEFPYDDLASVNGAPGKREAIYGVAGDLITLDKDKQTLTSRAGEVVWVENGALVLLTDTRTGIIDLELQRKRGSGAWTDVAVADSALLPANATAGSAIDLTAATTGFQVGDRIRVGYDSSSPTAYSFSGRLAVCAPRGD